MYRTDAQTVKPGTNKRSILAMVRNYSNRMMQGQRPKTYDQPGEWAQNILCFGYHICRAPLSGGESGQPQAMQRPVVRKEVLSPALKLSPNPADAWVAMNYHLETTADRACLMVRDATGREVEMIPISRTEGQAVHDTRRLAPGTYTVELLNGGKHIEAQKLVVRP